MPVEPAREPPERALVRLHRAGHEGAFDVLYREFFPRLVRLCRRWSPDEAAAEDLAQDTLVRALVYMSTFDDSRPMWPWLRAIASRLAADRAARHEREMPLGPQEGGAVEDPLRWVEERPLLSRALAGLSQRHRLALRLRYMEEWTTGEAAEFLGLSRPAFRQLLARARRRLQAEYRRVSGGAIGLVAEPMRWMRRIGQRASERFHREASSSPAASGLLSSDAFHQLVSGIAALLLMLGGMEGPATAGGQNGRAGELAAPRGELIKSAERVSGAGGQGGEGPGGTGQMHGGGRSQEPRGGAAEFARETVEDVKDPNRNVKQPEDAQITSIEFSPNYESDGTAFATGNARCRDDLCPSVLFVSRDGGGSWTRLPAEGFRGEQLLLPPGYGQEDQRIYAMGQGGLQVSEDGGKTFRSVAQGGALPAGPADISPAFNRGDPSILIGGAVLTRYRAGSQAAEPVPMPASPGSFYPAYSPSYEGDGIVFVGSVQPAPAGGGMRAVIFRCVGSSCSEVPIEGQAESPRMLIAPDFDAGGAIYAFTNWVLLASRDGGHSFEAMRGAWPGGWLHDLEFREDGSLLAGFGPDGIGARGGLYVSPDDAASWSEIPWHGFDDGVRDVEARASRLLVALEKGGLACSVDGGSSWAHRC